MHDHHHHHDHGHQGDHDHEHDHGHSDCDGHGHGDCHGHGNASNGAGFLLMALLGLGVGVGGVLWGVHTVTVQAEEMDQEALLSQDEVIAELREENATLKEAVAALQDEVAQSAAEGDDASAVVTPDSVAQQIFDIRERSSQEPIIYDAVPRDVVDTAIENDVLARYPKTIHAKIEQALVTIGFVGIDSDYSFPEAVSGLRRSQEGTFFDRKKRVLYYPDNAPLANPQERGKFVEAVMRAMTIDNAPGYYPPPSFLAADGDRALALDSLPIGDAVQVKIRYNLLDAFVGEVPPPSPESRQQFYGAPVYLRERALFPYLYGARFAEVLQQSGGWSRLDAAYARPPQSTAEIMHPELYLANPPFTPTPVSLGIPEVRELRPLWSDVAGEYGVMLLLRQSGKEENAEIAAEGWRGDRYIVYPNDSFVWKTVWADATQASEFFTEMCKFLLYRYEKEEDPAFDRDREFLMDLPDRYAQLRYGADGRTVIVLSAAEKAFAEEIDLALLGKLQ